MESSHNYLSEDVLVEILARLPVKALLRLRSVCKSWKSIIGSPEFRSLHLSSKRHPSKVLLTTKYPQFPGPCELVEWYLLLDNDHHRPADSSWLGPLDFPFEYPRFTSPHIVGSVNGLICESCP
ncbi:F-box protein [Striga asiatica]|uniref:F-box protein n=1 Tax=Striga asiatica TaxID=4170 RepID=A0A5A7QSP0_STRAF|nr:F-box protein [Striga asiatica]